MEEVAQFMNAMPSKGKSSKGKVCATSMPEDDELSWESDSH
jgi:hypothetical protein